MREFDNHWVNDNAFQQIISRKGKYDDAHTYQKKNNIVNCLKELFYSWLNGELVSRQIPVILPVTENDASIHLVGSFFMDVHDVWSDIDFLCITPPWMPAGCALQSFYTYLAHVSNVSELRAITSACVPIIKLKFDGVHINLSFANNQASDQKVVPNMHWKLCLSTLEIMKLFPTGDNFKLALRGIRLWARNNKIYSSSMSFLGGIAWAILLYRIYKASHCNNNPITASKIIINFFKDYHDYNWDNHIVSLNDLGTQQKARDRPIKKEQSCMVIKTDVSNTAFNVSKSSRKLIEQAIEKGFGTLRSSTWDDLFTPVPFFIYKYYIAVSVKTEKNEMNHLKNSEFVESKLRELIYILDDLSNSPFELAHLNTERFQIKLMNDMRYCTMWFIGLKLNNAREQITLDERKTLDAYFNFYLTTLRNQMRQDLNPSSGVNVINGSASLRIGLMNHKNLQKYLSPEELRT